MFARFARGGATVAIAAGLVFAVPLTSASAGAEAPILTLVQGAIKAAAPAAAASIVGGPGASLVVGTVATVGSLLYMTRDSWMPWVQGQFGDGGPGSVPRVGGTNPVILQPPVVDPGPGGVFSITLTNMGTSQVAVAGAVDYQCKLGGAVSTVTVGWPDLAAPYAGQSETWSAQCPSLGQVVHIQTRKSPWYTAPDQVAANQVSWGAGFDPLAGADYDVNVRCVKGDGTIATITRTTSNPGAGGGLLVPSCVAAFGADAHGEAIALRAGQSGQPKTDQWSADWGGAGALYPNCVGAGVACTYVVRFQDVPCIAGQVECINWGLRSQAEGNTDYKCYYGPYLLTLADCAISERAYEVTPNRLTKLNTDGNPDTWDEPRPAWVPAPAAVPVAPPAGAPGGAPAPIPPPTPMPTPPTAPNEGTDCWPSGGAAWNPAEWVLRPIKCALAWAFVPSSSYLNGWGDSINAEWTGSPVGSWINSVGALTPVITGTGCQGPAVSTGFMSSVPKLGSVMPSVIHPFDACSGVMATAAATSYLVLTAGISFYGGMKVVRQLGYAFGFQVHIGSERSTFT